MKCIIPGANVKVFGKAVHSLSKIGEELYLEPLDHGLALRTVSSCRSAYGSFVFAAGFFSHYSDGLKSRDTDDEEEAIKCKIGMKSCLTVFRSLATLEKTVDKCTVTIDSELARLTFQLYCRHGITKTHHLAFIECETLQAVFSKELCPNQLQAEARLLADVVVNFQTTQEEVSVIVNPEKVTFKNYTEDEADPSKVMHTQLSLTAEEFENFQVGVDTQVTFCLKELRAILTFCEAANMPVSMQFESAGKPVVFSLDSDPTFEANFVLATLADSSLGGSQSSSSQSQHSQQHRPTPSTGRRFQKKTRRLSADHSTNPVSVSNGFLSQSETVRPTSHRQGSEGRQPLEDEPAVPSEERGESSQPQPSTSKDSSMSPVLPVQSGPKTGRPGVLTLRPEDSEGSEVSEGSDDGEDTLVPGTPPSKKFKSAFFGLSQCSSTASSQGAPASAVVLAEDTDDED